MFTIYTKFKRIIELLILTSLIIIHSNSFANVQISNLITPVSYFVDHVKQLSELKHNLSKYGKASLVGTSGIGKTQLARTYAYENKDKYNLIWVFDCNLDINAEFVKLAKELNHLNKTNINLDVLHAKKEVMEYLTDKNDWLLVFDNLKIGDNQKVRDIVDWENNGNVIFCSQEGDILSNIIEISKFKDKDAITLAKNILGNSDQDAAKFLADVFKGYPILIVQGGQLLNQVKGLDKDKYKTQIYKSADKIRLNIELASSKLPLSAQNLLTKIVLINNQKFSKQVLSIITDNQDTLDDDIYQLSKFALISNVSNSPKNPIYEMHDVIALKILEMNNHKNISLLEEIILKINNATKGLGTQKGYISRTEITMPENLDIVLRNAEKYDINIHTVMELRKNLLVVYVNTQNKDGCEQLIGWFNEQEKHKRFKENLMDKKTKRNFAAYLGLIGVYKQQTFSDYNSALIYFNRVLAILIECNYADSLNLKYSITAHVALCHALLGDIKLALQYIKETENIYKQGVDEEDIAVLEYVQTIFYMVQGKYEEALEYINKDINRSLKHVSADDHFFTVSYILKSEILNNLGRYTEAFNQAKQLLNMHQNITGKDHEIFGRIYTQMARSQLGMKEINKAADNIGKAILFFTTAAKQSNYANDFGNPHLAASYVVLGDILVEKGKLKKSIESYRDAQKIYFYLYKKNIGNVANVSYLYLQGAKASCKAKDFYHYKSFGRLQIKDFGKDHPNTTAMLNYCHSSNMDLWSEDD